MAEHERVLVLLGQETTRGRMHTGLYLLVGGFLLGITALLLFFLSQGPPVQYGQREAALILGATAVTTFFFGISTALPSKNGMRVASYIGVALCLLAIVLLAVHYPMQFNVVDSERAEQAASDKTALDTSLFAVGLALIVAGAFVSVLGYWVESLRWGASGEAEEEWTGRGYEVPDWVVEQDIDEAMRRHGVSWGLADKQDAVQIEVADLGDDVFIGGKGKVKTVRLSGARIDKATVGLQQTRPDFARQKSLPGDWTDDAVERLRAFQREKAERPKEFTPKLGFWARVFHRRSRLTPIERALEAAQEGIEVGGTGGGLKIVIDDKG